MDDYKNILNNKNILLTGGNGGIGKSIVKKLSKYNCKIIITYNKNKKNALSLIKEINNNRIEALQLDLSSSNNINNFCENIKKYTDKIDILINNAGVNKTMLFNSTDIEEWLEVFQINCLGHIMLIKKILPYMIKQKYGKIINILSISALSGTPGLTSYSSAKAALLAFSKSLVKEVSKYNININCISPGYVDTGMTNNYSEDIKKSMMEKIPMKRFAKPEEIADLILFLIAGECNYINGQNIIIDGGIN